MGHANILEIRDSYHTTCCDNPTRFFYTHRYDSLLNKRLKHKTKNSSVDMFKRRSKLTIRCNNNDEHPYSVFYTHNSVWNQIKETFRNCKKINFRLAGPRCNNYIIFTFFTIEKENDTQKVHSPTNIYKCIAWYN